VAKPHQHNTKTNKTQHTQDAALRPEWTGRWVSFRAPSGRTDPTDTDAGRTDVSVDPARRNDRTPRGRSSRRQRPRRRSTTLWLALHPLHRRQLQLVSSTDRRSRFRSRPADRSALTPAVAYDGDVVVSRRALASGLVHRADAAPCVLQQQRNGTAVPSIQRRQHSRCEAPLRQPKSLGLCALTLSAHCRALSQLSFSQLNFSHSYRTLQNTCVL